MHRGVARILHWWLQKLSAEAFFLKKADDLFSRRPQNFTVLNTAGPTSQQSQFFFAKNPLSRRLGAMAPLTLFWLRRWQCNAKRCIRCHTATQCVCERSRSVSSPNDPSKNQPAADRLTAALAQTSVETRISVNVVNVAARIASPPTTCMWTTNDDLRLRWRRHAIVIGGS